MSRLQVIEPVWKDSDRGAVVVGRGSIPPLGTITIASVHARVIRHRVIPALRDTFDELRPRLEDRFIVGGDFNTARSAARRWPRNGHAEFWNDLEDWGFKDCHYLLNGQEQQSFWRGAARHKPATADGLQDDHVFVDVETIGFVTGSFIWDTQEVRGLSDHGPVIVEMAHVGEGD